jgi:flagellar motor component MotA
MTTKKQTIEEEIKYLKEMIDEARSEGMQNVANLFAEQLQTILAMDRFDRGELA